MRKASPVAAVRLTYQFSHFIRGERSLIRNLKRHRRLYRRSILAVAFAGALMAFAFVRPTTESRLRLARMAEQSGHYDQAFELVSSALATDAKSIDALLFAGELLARHGDPIRAFSYYRQLPEQAHGDNIANHLRNAGQMAIHLGHARDAERFYKQVLRSLPDDQISHRRLSGLFLAESRRWESIPHLFQLLRAQAFTLEELGFIGNSEELYDAVNLMNHFEEAVPDDAVPLIGRARLHLFKGFNEKGESLLRKIIKQQPDFIEAQAQLGVLLVSESRHLELEQWRQQLPESAFDHPEIWWVLGTYARKHADSAAAIRCAWETLKRDPNHLGATYQLAQLLAAAGQTESAQILADRASKLETLATTIHDVLMRESTADRMLRCADTAEELGRLWEAWGWHVSIDTYHKEDAIPGARQRLKSFLTPDTPQTLLSHQLANRFDFSGYPLPKHSYLSAPERSSPHDSSDQISFQEITAVAGLTFRYENGTPVGKPGLMVYQSIGGGVAVIDFDLDGHPDLFFPQASQSSPNSTCLDAADRLYRNVAGHCVDVTESAIPPDSGFGFGATVGDFDGDGFADLYVANAGRNRLLRNNGDGIFTDVTESAGLQNREWTTSCLMVDLNGDGLPDLYDVNYCTGRRPFEHRCLRAGSELTRTCIPTEFEASDDHLLINLGDGSFKDVSAASGIQIPDARGLGIVAAKFDDQPGLDLYVANDMTANFLFLNRTPSNGDTPRFVERGVLTGTAYDADGRPQASMGIAADDADGNGLLDLFVTNFFNESNTLYCQQSGGFFIDASREFDLRTPSMSQLGFGTQFIDADLDGRPDLVVANGHVDDFTEDGTPFRMKSQFFRNQGPRFGEISDAQLGEFFAQPQLGRGLARLDWNRDGKEDFVVSRLIDPAALVVNRTPVTGHFLAVRLVGRSYRDAIGSEVKVKAGNLTLVKQLTAGDGFECSNERKLVFGLGNAARIDSVQIVWISGLTQDFTNIELDTEVLIVESTSEPLVVSRPEALTEMLEVRR